MGNILSKNRTTMWALHIDILHSTSMYVYIFKTPTEYTSAQNTQQKSQMSACCKI